MIDTYTAEIKCSNCKEVNYIQVQKGMSIKEHLERYITICDNCEIPIAYKKAKECAK